MASNANRPPACLAFHPPSDLPSSRSTLQQHGNAYPPRSVLRLVTRREGLSRQGTSMTSMNIGTEACTQELLLVLTPVIRTACPACRMSVTVLIESTDRVCRAASHSLLACLPCQGGEGTGRNLSVCRLIRDAEVRTSPAWYITKVGAYLHVAENEYSPFCFSFRASRASVRFGAAPA